MAGAMGFSISDVHGDRDHFWFSKNRLCVVISRSLVHHSALCICGGAFVRAIHSSVMIEQVDMSVPLTPKPACHIISAVAFQYSGQLLTDPRHFSTSDNSRFSTPQSLISCHAGPHGKRPPHTRWFTELPSSAYTFHTVKRGREDLLTMLQMKSGIQLFTLITNTILFLQLCLYW